jgi:hypothetical protein
MDTSVMSTFHYLPFCELAGRVADGWEITSIDPSIEWSQRCYALRIHPQASFIRRSEGWWACSISSTEGSVRFD